VRVNVDEVETRGVEFETLYLIDDNWDVGLRAAYSDPTIEDWDDRLCFEGDGADSSTVLCPAVSGDDFDPRNSKWDVNVQLGYTRPAANDWLLVARTNYTWKPSLSDSAEDRGTTGKYNDPLNVLGFTLGLSNDAGLTVRLWGKNILDENIDNSQMPVSRQNVSGVDTGNPDHLVRGFTPGREYGVTINYPF
jgi:outer membrane receptor protein involved in Fe transport